MYEHQNNIAQLKAEGTVALKLAQDGNRNSEMDLRKDKRNLKVELKEMELSHEDMIKTLKKVDTTNIYICICNILAGILWTVDLILFLAYVIIIFQPIYFLT